MNQINSKLTDLDEIPDCVGDIQNKNVIFGGDFNVIFDCFLETQVGKPSLKKHFLSIKSNSNNGKLNLVEI